MARQKPPFEFVDKSEKPILDVAAEEVRHHIQIRVDENGRSKSDGRRGRIILEDANAPPEILKWLKSPQCRRADRSNGGKAVYVWCNDAQVPPGSPDTPGDDGDGEDLSALPVPQLPPANEMAVKLAHAYQQRIEDLTDYLEKQLKEAREHHQKEVARIRAAAAAEVESCDAQIKAARERLAQERKREDEEMEALSVRRRGMVEERSQMSKDLREEVSTQREYRQLMAASTKKSDLVETMVNAGVKLKEHGIPVDDLTGAVATWIMSKAGVKVPTE